MTIQKLPLSKQIAYAFGMMGWSIMINLISVILIYLYLPPANSGLPNLITQVVVFGIFNVIAIITASGRLADAIYDPFIAQFSDKSKNPVGRRIPLMKKAILPSLVFCFLIFYPLKQEESSTNIVWLVVMLIGFYISSTTYIIPYNALLPELAPTSEDKVKLATWQSVGYVFGIGIASNAFNLTEFLQRSFEMQSRISALQLTVFVMCVLAAVCMLVTCVAIDEKKYCVSKPSSVPLKQALKQTLTNKNFLLFVVADFSYFISVTIITSGLMYFVTVLLQLPESIGNKLMITMVLVSFIFYPIINYLAKKIGKKIIVLISLGLLSIIFLGIYFLGKFSLDAEVQIYGLIAFAAIPLASLNILPNAILAEIIEKDSKETNENKEAIYFAVRYFFVKIAQTFGIALFAMLLIYGKDVGNDLGIRLTGILGFGLCAIATLIFTKFKENKL
ncbi:MAG TPA: MFS transporter [Bacteroidia bacterium]|jgi:GPH family glycoside/pentoside/hexuronide:cation symporter|nr:MFS transporter [Bacteroidia bacterium]